jgi:beta-glucosidase
LVQAWYGGSEAGTALASVLFGDVNPSGKLPCTYPKSLADEPAHQGGKRTYPGENGTVHYDEGLLVGYRWFDAKNVEPLFPFGFGLSYTTFTYGNLKVIGDGSATATVECEITNSGAREGAEVVQVYVQPKKPSVLRPVKELKGFAKINLKPGETKTIHVPLNDRSFAYYSPEKKGWVAEAGEFGILVGASSREIRLTGSYTLTGTTQVQ